jgi:hypothetical protein
MAIAPYRPEMEYWGVRASLYSFYHVTFLFFLWVLCLLQIKLRWDFVEIWSFTQSVAVFWQSNKFHFATRLFLRMSIFQHVNLVGLLFPKPLLTCKVTNVLLVYQHTLITGRSQHNWSPEIGRPRHCWQILVNACSFNQNAVNKNKQTKQTPWPDSMSKLNRPSVHRLSAKLVPTFADRRCHVVSVTDPYGRILDFLDRSHYFQVATRLYSWGWADPVSALNADADISLSHS